MSLPIRNELISLFQYLDQNRTGEQKLQKILDEFYEKMNEDAMIGFFFFGKDLKSIAAKQKEFLLRAMFVIPHYTGKPPAKAHEELPPIRLGQFNRRLVILKEVLTSHKIPDPLIEIWIRFERAFESQILK